MTDNEINRAVCEKVLGWAHFQREPDSWWVDFKQVRTCATPDFCNDWAAFGILWEHLAKTGALPCLEIDSEAGGLHWGEPMATVYGAADKNYPRVSYDPDPCRALAMAALKAHGVEDKL